MKQVNMYIAVDFHGRSDSGTGKSVVILEYTKASNNETKAKSYIYEYSNTTKHRLCILAILEGFKHLTERCEVFIQADDAYVTETINNKRMVEWEKAKWSKGNKPVANADLWVKSLDCIDHHLVHAETIKHKHADFIKNLPPKQTIENRVDRPERREFDV